MENQKTVPANPDNDLKFREFEEETKKKPEGGLTECTDSGEKIEYFTE